MDPAPVTDRIATEAPEPAVVVDDASEARCPFPHQALAKVIPGCPIDHVGAEPRVVHRTRADLFVRRLLRIPETPVGMSSDVLYRSFQRSMLISGLRCTLTYVVFPFLLPAFSFIRGVGPVLGILIGSFAMVCDVFTIRRFFVADHKYRWPISMLAFSIMTLLGYLLIDDVVHVITHL